MKPKTKQLIKDRDLEIDALQAQIQALEIMVNEYRELAVDNQKESENAIKGYKRLNDLCETVVNRLLRQTIAYKSHGERNTELRALCTDIIQIQKIAFDDIDDIPF